MKNEDLIQKSTWNAAEVPVKVCFISHAGISTANIAKKPSRQESIRNVALELCLGFEQRREIFWSEEQTQRKGKRQQEPQSGWVWPH